MKSHDLRSSEQIIAVFGSNKQIMALHTIYAVMIVIIIVYNWRWGISLAARCQLGGSLWTRSLQAADPVNQNFRASLWAKLSSHTHATEITQPTKTWPEHHGLRAHKMPVTLNNLSVL